MNLTVLSFTATRWTAEAGPEPCQIERVYTPRLRSHIAALPSWEPLTISDQPLEAVTPETREVWPRMRWVRVNETGCSRLRSFRSTRHSRIMLSEDPVTSVSMSANVAQLQNADSTT